TEPLSEPLLMTGPEAPWAQVRRSLRWHGHVVAYADWHTWEAATAADPRLRPMLGRRDGQRLEGLADPVTRARFAASRLLLRHTAGAALRVPPDGVELAYKPGGSPYLRGCDQLDVSISHTRDLIVVGLNRRGRIGVDTEPGERRIRYEAVERQVCTPAECRWLSALPAPERERGLLRLWTLKEAYTKALGQGMRLGFNQFGFAPDARTLRTRTGAPADQGEWSFGSFDLLDGYLVSVACQDTGLDATSDTAVATMLDEGFLGEVVGLLAVRREGRGGGRP
ncbi:4'-phosphopantetheinyl transferase superfamily protein, partial [Streptomyces sp. BG9H]